MDISYDYLDLWIYYLSHGFMEISLITYHTDGKQGFTGFNDTYHCLFVIAIACCAL